jgi:UDP-N-acetylmuramate--alanine ligase
MEVSGYDKTETALTKELVKEGIPVHYEDNPALAPKDAELIVYTPAVPADHRELEYYRQHNYTVIKRSDLLGAITGSSFNICVAGTHGKTTVTTMIAHILRDSGYGCNAFLGGISVNYNSNFWSQAPSEGNERNVCVVEADEYDRSFLKLSPDMAVITAMDADHLDIYGTEEAVEQAFIEFSRRLKPGGFLLNKSGLSKGGELAATSHKTYGVNDDNADVHAGNIRMANGAYRFDVWMKDWRLNDLVLNMGGMHNVENATAAVTIAHQLGIEDGKIKKAIETFKGVKRRFEYIVKNQGLVFIDDYAHHPEELRALISGAKGLFSGMKCTVVFQPHLFTRTRDFADGFSESLNLADEVFLLPIYPAREMPIAGVSSELIAKRMEAGKAVVGNKEELLKIIKSKAEHKELELLITAGAGDIDTLVMPIKEILDKTN